MRCMCSTRAHRIQHSRCSSIVVLFAIQRYAQRYNCSVTQAPTSRGRGAGTSKGCKTHLNLCCTWHTPVHRKNALVHKEGGGLPKTAPATRTLRDYQCANCSPSSKMCCRGRRYGWTTNIEGAEGAGLEKRPDVIKTRRM